MNNRGQAGIFIPIFGFILGVTIWAVWLGDQLSFWGQRAISNSNLTGGEAFFYANLNLWYFIILIVGLVLFYAVGGGND